MTTTQQLVTVLVVALATWATRFLVFWVFPAGKQVPAFIHYLGSVLPTAVMGLLVVYSLKDIQLTTAPYAAPELIAVLVVSGLHLWRRNFLLSISVGTLLFMFLIQQVFI